ncbi:DUF4129 domain-containing protein [Kineosporia sp. R_H_3]|uniref:DUF4129 domain-containing protein n=1 Tax=Kineosporia sp. R_H_3 TaxID=1961848 RepID=UPI000B4B797F|nr:DUF4129 domain-containing protein [Kineosporia sp. R_H_3]
MSALAAAGAGVAALAQVPLEPDRDQARQWAVEELAKREYAEQRPGALSQLLDWILEQLDKLSGLGGPGQGTGTAFALVAGVVVVLVAVAVLVTGRVVRRARQADPAPVFDGTSGTARTHRGAADEAAARGDWRTAVVERFRAVVRELEERAVLVPQPGRTADEAAAEAARWLPGLGDPLRSAARLFDDVRYGDRPADAAGDAALRALDAQVVAARTVAPQTEAVASPVVPS